MGRGDEERGGAGRWGRSRAPKTGPPPSESRMEPVLRETEQEAAPDPSPPIGKGVRRSIRSCPSFRRRGEIPGQEGRVHPSICPSIRPTARPHGSAGALHTRVHT